MANRITNNIGWKILAVIIAFFVWLLITNYEDPLVTREFEDIVVKKINEEAITSQKKSIEYKEGELVTLRVRGKRSIVDKMNHNDIHAYADLQKKSITGAVDIIIEAQEDIFILEKSPSMLLVELENIITVQKEIQYYMEGEPKENYIHMTPTIIPNNIEIEGPESKINRIKSVLVPVNVENVTRDVTLYGTPKIMDEENIELTGLVKSANQVQIEVPIQKTKKVNIVESLNRKVANNFSLTKLVLEQNTVHIVGKEEVIDKVEEIRIENIDLSSYRSSAEISVNLKEYLPEGIEIYNDKERIKVTIEVEPIIEKTFALEHQDINVRYIADNLTFKYVDNYEMYVTYRGLRSNLNEITEDIIEPSISLFGKAEGIHEIEVQVYSTPEIEVVSVKPKVTVELLKVEESQNEESINEESTNESATSEDENVEVEDLVDESEVENIVE